MSEANTTIVAVHARSGGCTKSTTAYEMAYKLDGVLIDLEHDGGGVTYTWGYKPTDRIRAPLLDALTTGKTPKPLKGFMKPDLIPGHPELVDCPMPKEELAELLQKWANEWDHNWVVIDTHPGAGELTHGALGAADVVLVPVPLRTKDLNALELLAEEMPDYPIVVIPSLLRRTPPLPERKRLRQIIERTDWQVAPGIPYAEKFGERKKRIALSAEERPAKMFQKIAEAYEELTQYVKEYAQ